MSEKQNPMGSPYGDWSDLDAALDRLMNSYNSNPPVSKPLAEQVKPVPEPKKEEKPVVTVEGEEPKPKIPEEKPIELKEFDPKSKNELIGILLENKINIIEVANTKIIFEYEGSKYAFIPIT